MERRELTTLWQKRKRGDLIMMLKWLQGLEQELAGDFVAKNDEEQEEMNRIFRLCRLNRSVDA